MRVNADLVRKRYEVERKEENRIYIQNQPYINFCSNDYLNLSHHPSVKKALAVGAYRYGVGGCASPLMVGYSSAHRMLEEALAEFLGREKVLLFSSGYLANIGLFSALSPSVIIADKYCHASLIDGMRLSQAKLYRFPHRDHNQAKALLKKHEKALLVTESIFSMQGHINDVPTLSTLAQTHQAQLVVDDAHGVGVLGDNGAGISEHFKLTSKAITFLITPFGKAFGSMGAAISGEESWIEWVLQKAKTYCYSTSLPPAICHATLQSLTILRHENWRREKLKALIHFFHCEAAKRNLNFLSTDETPIKFMILGKNQDALQLQASLMRAGLYVSCIRPPTVQNHAAGIRISLNCAHTEAELIYLLDTLCKNYDSLKQA